MTDLSSADILAKEMAASAGTYKKRELALLRGEGVRVFDAEGKSYIDCIAGIGTACLGHSHPELSKAIAEQASSLMSAPELLCNPQRAAYQQRLLETFPDSFKRVFLCNSGAEAVEAALKFARFSTGRGGVLALRRGFHGKTLGALSITAEENYRKPFEPLLPGVVHVAAGNIEAVQNALSENEFGCMVFEAVQGEGGIRPLDVEFVKQAVQLVRNSGALIVADEIQAGMGRSGDMWAYQALGVEPDLVCAAKGIAGGVPMGACVIGDAVAELPVQSHTSTFGGNPLACRAALCVLDVIERDSLLENCRQRGEQICGALNDANLSKVREVRGRGLLIGVELKERAGVYMQKAMDKGLLCLLAGPRVIRLLPPLIISEQEAQEVVDILVEILRDDSGSDD